jgi:hypothetical protein
MRENSALQALPIFSSVLCLAGTVALPEDTQRRPRYLVIEADRLTEDFRTVPQWAVAKGLLLPSPFFPAA